MPRLRPLLAVLAFLLPLAAQDRNPLIGRWDFTLSGNHAVWLGVSQKGGATEVWFQPSGGNVYQVKNFKIAGAHITLNLNARSVIELDAAGDKLTGTQKNGNNTTVLNGTRAPELKRAAPAAWTAPQPLFNGKDLSGWEPMGADSHWTVRDGLLINDAHGANLKSTRKFDDFKLHFEVNCPDGGNSGFYLRGRYEIQIEYEPLTANPPERRIGSVYGRIEPKGNVPRTPGTWETFDVTLSGRTLTVTRNGVLTIDRQEIEGPTGGALDADEAQPGSFYIQGDHTGGLKFRNITIALPK